MNRKPSVPRAEVAAFLEEHHGAPVVDLKKLPGGFWSAGWAYRAGEQELVLRLGHAKEGYEIDRLAGRFRRPGLPIPEVLDVGDALGVHYAISTRLHGRFIEDVSEQEADAAGGAMTGLLDALRSVDAPGEAVEWHSPATSAGSWREWLTNMIEDDPARSVNSFTEALAAIPESQATFDACVNRFEKLVHVVPERRDLVHGDLLHQNVLVDADAAEVTGVFSWKLSVLGDFLFDVALCTFWAPWHPGIGAAAMFDRVLSSPSLDDEAKADASRRHYVYELHLAATHLGWNAFIDDVENRDRLVEHSRAVLKRGPLPLPKS